MPYIYAVGRRKTSAARVRLYAKDSRSEIIINDKDYKKYFPYFEHQQIVEQPLKKVNMFGQNYISVRLTGGGIKSQAEAVRHGIARALLNFNEDWKKTLRGEGYLTRDSRKKERKKPGLKRARRAPQWAKR
ncbi:MAG TPA: 30S ribosomal protein S9 [Patescibacteria group bacterium]|nr:30S ribosomal protein S9 [Patescibacteria group bacterium]